MQIQFFLVEIKTYRDLSRLLWLFVIFVDFSIFSRSQPRNNGFLDFYKYLDGYFSSQPFLFTFCASKLAKSAENSNFFSKSLNKNRDYLKKSCLSRFISMVWISLDDLDKNHDAAKSWLKSLDLKILTEKVGLDTKDSLDLDLDWSRMSRPPGLVWLLFFWSNFLKPIERVNKVAPSCSPLPPVCIYALKIGMGVSSF